MNKTEVKEKLQLIANRVPPSDRWRLVLEEHNTTIHPSLTDALEAWFQLATIKPKAFRLDLASGRLYAILTEEVEIKEPEPKKYSIYGDYEF
jgi:hypothetical protein